MIISLAPWFLNVAHHEYWGRRSFHEIRVSGNCYWLIVSCGVVTANDDPNSLFNRCCLPLRTIDSLLQFDILICCVFAMGPSIP